MPNAKTYQNRKDSCKMATSHDAYDYTLFEFSQRSKRRPIFTQYQSLVRRFLSLFFIWCELVSNKDEETVLDGNFSPLL